MRPPVRAVILDVYHTLLAVGKGPANAEDLWRDNWSRQWPGSPPRLSAFDAACQAVIIQDHAAARARGTAWPEVDWPSVVGRAVPALAELEAQALEDLIWLHARLRRRTAAMAGAREFVDRLHRQGILTGIASNAQAYTLREMEEAGWRTARDFVPGLCFWSFRHGFSKPDSAVFTWLTARLAARGISPHEILMIGDRPDNDLLPARAAGWQTWHFQGVWPVPEGGRA